jgi:hypothetical protein
MRTSLIAAVVAAGLGFITFSSASALPVLGAAAISAFQASDLTPVSGGCGRGYHRSGNRCVPN